MTWIDLSPFSLAIAMEVELRISTQPEALAPEVLQGIIEDRPAFDMKAARVISRQVNDLMALTDPPHDQARMVLLMVLPGNTGMMFQRTSILLSDVKLLPSSPVMRMAAQLAASLDTNWDEFRQAATSLPIPEPNRIVGANGRPVELLRPNAGPDPSELKDFLPNGGA